MAHPADHSGYIAIPSAPSSSSLRKASPGVTLHPDNTYTYAYGPPGLPGLAHNGFALCCAVFASIGGLTFGYDQGVIANVLVMKDFAERFPIGPWEKGLMTAVLELGALFGALSAGVLADRYSRRHSIFIACLIFCVGSAMQCAAHSLGHLIAGRAIGGVGVGALSMLSPLYMAEIAPPEVRGSLMALEQLAIVLGVVLGFWTGFGTREIPSSLSWRLPLGLQLLPGALLLGGCLLLPPSPRLLVLHGRDAEARTALARLRGREEADGILQIELLEMRIEVALIHRAAHLDARTRLHADTGMQSEARAWARLWSPEYRARTAVGVGMMFFQQWSGINALLYYGPTLVAALGIGSSGAAGGGEGESAGLMVSGGIGIVQLLAVGPAIVWIDSLGRRPLLRGGSIAMALAHALVAVLVFLYEGQWAAHRVGGWVAVGCLYAFTAAYGVSYGPIGWVLPSEVFPLSVRSKGVALSTASNWVNNFIIGLITPALMEWSAPATFAVFAVACSAAYVWATYFVPETAGVSLEEIDAVFRSEAGRRDAEIKAELEHEMRLLELVRSVAGVGDEED
ncbi:general substrate transporter [Athelia psychrophila]|uniref:General substrate transporter n=1 Tax=Athelia psychrophila TaxID=1759441 RepID=A0A166BV92_9AGAM|nr:general substrate transporter [Fibularhizoctonia sp. CBS 109695]